MFIQIIRISSITKLMRSRNAIDNVMKLDLPYIHGWRRCAYVVFGLDSLPSGERRPNHRPLAARTKRRDPEGVSKSGAAVPGRRWEAPGARHTSGFPGLRGSTTRCAGFQEACCGIHEVALRVRFEGGVPPV